MAVIAIDLGTTGCKSALFDGSEMLGSAYRHYSYTSPEDGWAEQDPEFGRMHRAGCRSYVDACAADALPLGLAKGCRVKAPVAKGSLIARSMAEPVDTLLHRLRAEQDRFSEGLV